MRFWPFQRKKHPKEPKWVSDTMELLAGQPNGDMKQIAYMGTIDGVMRNARGAVIRQYNVGTDRTEWRFGNGQWPQLVNPETDSYYADDPFMGRDDIPLAEFVTYLNDWYFPRKQRNSAV